jgi:hypothetical protein
MLCDKYKEALIEAAANGTALANQIREHVNLCVRCREMFAAQQILFAVVDAGLRTTVNVEVPSSFLPNVRVKLAEETAPARTWSHSWAFVCATVSFVLALVLVGLPRHHEKQTGAESFTKNKTPTVVNGLRLDPTHGRKTPRRISKGHTQQNLSAANRDPEVLVPQGEEQFLERYYASLRNSAGMNLVLADKQGVEVKPLEIEQIQVRELAIESLEQETGLQRTNTR